jgi:hypothetical protein
MIRRPKVDLKARRRMYLSQPPGKGDWLALQLSLWVWATEMYPCVRRCRSV